MGPTNSIKSETNIKLPFAFIFFSIFAFVLSQLLFLANSQYFVDGIFRIPAIWSGAHLLILGWAVMVCMGAMYQLVPVAFLTPIWNEKFGFFQFAVTAFGIAAFSITLYFDFKSSIIPGIIMLAGFLFFLFQMLMTLKKQEKANILTLFVATALICLLLTISFGILMLLHLIGGRSSQFYNGLFMNHMFLGLAGWFSLLIFGFSYKMGPMFSLSHGYSMKPARFVYGFYLAGLAVSSISFFIASSIFTKLGFFLLFIGFSLFARHMQLILQKRVKKKLDRPFMFSLLAIVFGEIIHFAAFIAAVTDSLGKYAGALAISYLLYWIAFSIIGYLYKIVPFLWWTHKYSNAIGKENVPMLKDMINEKLALPLFIAFISGTLAVTLSLIWKIDFLFYIGQCTNTIAASVFGFALLKVINK